MKSDATPYHHGDLANALLRAARTLLEEGGLEALSLRGVTRRAGVSATAAVPHFGTLAGLRSALAAQGYDALADALLEAQKGGVAPRHEGKRASDTSERPASAAQAAGLAYIAFALANPDLFRLMFRNALLDHSRPDLAAASGRAFEALRLLSQGKTPGAMQSAGMAGLWARVHGLAILAIDGMLGPLMKEARAPSLTGFLQAALENQEGGGEDLTHSREK
ncbi:TetR/AcrR family transcriptional regulator [Asaia sp. BMEF1]|uniref:TetR/AcrR family transcriptional regulator n=1 Tax=Asaia sp. BMEF1 TaxID=3155932 RepID=UPI003F679F21